MSELSRTRGSEGYEIREEDGPVLVFGISASVIYGIILQLFFSK